MFVLFGMTAGVLAEDEIEVRVVPVGFYEIDQAVEIAKSLLSPEGKVFGDERTLQLIVQDFPEYCDRVENYFKDQIPPKNIQIKVTFIGHDSAVIDPRYLGWDNTVSGRGWETQMITVLDGGQGYLHVGEKLPEPAWFFSYAQTNGMLNVVVDYRDVGSRLLVRPIIRGNVIDILLIPEISYVANGRHRSIVFTGLETRVSVRPGETIEIGGLQQDAQFSNRFFQTHTGQSIRIQLTPEIL